MRKIDTVLILATLCAPGTGFAFQPAAGGTAAQGSPAQVASPASAATAKAGTVSALLKPAMDTVWEMVGSLQIEKWKRGPIRDETSANVVSIRHDIESTLPDLLSDADTNPDAVSKVLPVARNVDALYDVLLRVVEAARMTAPAEQFAKLQDALSGLEKARHALNDHLLEAATGQEKRIADLRIALKTQPAPVCPVASPPPAPATPAVAAKKTLPKKRKPTPTPGTVTPDSKTATSGAQPSSTTKPNQ